MRITATASGSAAIGNTLGLYVAIALAIAAGVTVAVYLWLGGRSGIERKRRIKAMLREPEPHHPHVDAQRAPLRAEGATADSGGQRPLRIDIDLGNRIRIEAGKATSLEWNMRQRTRRGPK